MSEGRPWRQLRDWVAGARPRTLPAAIVPVVVGSGVAAGYGRFSAWRAALALVVALALQVGVNYANDYSDGIRGTDERRVGPVRLVASGLARPRQVLAAALGCFAVACAGRPGPRGRHLLVAAAGGRRRRGRRVVLHRRQPPLRLPGPRRGLGVPVLRPGRRGGNRLRADGPDAVARGGGRGPGRPARLRAAGDQQPARHPDRHRDRQAHARGGARRSPDPRAVRGLHRDPVLRRGGHRRGRRRSR